MFRMKGRSAAGIGWVVFVWLAVLTIVEYFAAIELGKNVPILVVFAVLKAWLIVRYFMHVLSAFREHGEDH